ncbi:Ada metal-binding domain-containing protein [Alicyclobacillus sp.]|uniref:Ada metal-binding domain-containing protein n=1 Tax=Alicyclobacillus sp. TaxID=61169 RepID=UPI0025C214AB|nr:Ada metal-binding domain-containing protein [Alicyclobacillus sp.]MCL6516648.1 hypothetical protein [Alicyclobacillus sp.]
MPEDLWHAIVNCDVAYDGRFYYGVVSTGVFCRPSCRSKTPKREHVRIFLTTGEARAAGFRPCKRCKPDLQSAACIPRDGEVDVTRA